ncbi:hypothetical protein [Nocardia sputi]|nr:hypothetical protein [Nocardia sputi]MBF6204168.1 hypothetical protein [Streptomyces gardneri]UAK30627.1 hypothetical protein K8O92_22320 [Nocardia asteroides]
MATRTLPDDLVARPLGSGVAEQRTLPLPAPPLLPGGEVDAHAGVA